jgi:hypothetical protein
MNAIASAVNQGLQRSAFQDRVLAIPEDIDIFLGGGRGGGKDYAIALLILRHVEQYGKRARVFYLRQTYRGLADFELVCRELFGLVYGTDARYNAADHVWRFPGGGYMELGQLESQSDYAKWQGRSCTLLIVSEAGQYAMPDLLDMMRSNVRGPRDMPLRMVIAANPGGPGHFWIAKRYVFIAKPWTPFVEEKSKREWIHAPSTFLDNPFIDQDAYRAQLESSCPSDKELLRAWLEGDWAVARGAYFSSVLEESRNAVGPFKVGELPKDGRMPWSTWLAFDHGSSAPSVCYLMAESPGATFCGKFYPRGSILVLDEYAVFDRSNLNKGLGWTAATTAEALREFCAQWKAPPSGVADDSVFAKTGHANSIAQEYAAKGVRFSPARKADRITGWQQMRRLLADAGKPDVPGLYISRACEYFWSTVPYLARDQKRVEDVDSSGPDHGADSVRYGILRRQPAMSINLGMAH